MESVIAQTGCRHVDKEGVLLAGICCPRCWKSALSKQTLVTTVAFNAFNPWLVQNYWGRFYRNAAVLLAGWGVCSNVRWGGVCLVHSTPPSAPWDMAGDMWLLQDTRKSCLQLAGLLLCIALPPGAGEKHGWLSATATLHPQLCAAPLRGHQHRVWAYGKKQPSKKVTAASYPGILLFHTLSPWIITCWLLHGCHLSSSDGANQWDFISISGVSLTYTTSWFSLGDFTWETSGSDPVISVSYNVTRALKAALWEISCVGEVVSHFICLVTWDKFCSLHTRFSISGNFHLRHGSVTQKPQLCQLCKQKVPTPCLWWWLSNSLRKAHKMYPRYSQCEFATANIFF